MWQLHCVAFTKATTKSMQITRIYIKLCAIGIDSLQRGRVSFVAAGHMPLHCFERSIVLLYAIGWAFQLTYVCRLWDVMLLRYEYDCNYIPLHTLPGVMSYLACDGRQIRRRRCPRTRATYWLLVCRCPCWCWWGLGMRAGLAMRWLAIWKQFVCVLLSCAKGDLLATRRCSGRISAHWALFNYKGSCLALLSEACHAMRQLSIGYCSGKETIVLLVQIRFQWMRATESSFGKNNRSNNKQSTSRDHYVINMGVSWFI